MLTLIIRSVYVRQTQTLLINCHLSIYFVLMHVRKIAKGDYWIRHICLSVRQHETRLPLDEFA